jgi:hypothetical protein
VVSRTITHNSSSHRLPGLSSRHVASPDPFLFSPKSYEAPKIVSGPQPTDSKANTRLDEVAVGEGKEEERKHIAHNSFSEIWKRSLSSLSLFRSFNSITILPTPLHQTTRLDAFFEHFLFRLILLATLLRPFRRFRLLTSFFLDFDLHSLILS